jgi:hypothetical protein
MAMAGAGNASPDAARRRYLAAKTRAGVARCISLHDGVAPGRIDLARVPDQQWQLDFSSGVPVFKPMTRAEAVALMTQRRAAMKSVSDWGFDVDWGDVWNAVSDTVTEVVDVVVTAVIDPVTNLVSEIKAQVNLIIGGVNALYHATIDFAEQVFAMAEGIFAKIKVAWKQLQDWLGFLFGWGDISRTAEVLLHLSDLGLAFVGQATVHAKTAVDAKVDALTAFVQNGMDQYITEFAAGRTLDGILKSTTSPVPAYDERASNNPVLDAFMNNYGAASLPRATRAQARAIDSTLQNLLDELQALAEGFNDDPNNKAASKVFNEAIAYFGDIQKNPDNILQLTLLGLLKLGESVAMYALVGFKQLLNLFFDAITGIIGLVRDLFIEPWQIPIVSDLYEYATGRPFVSLGQLFALIVAIPVTSIYKAELGVAPYPDDAAVAQVTNGLTADWLARRAWGGSPQAMAPAAPADADWLNVVRYILNTAFTVNYGARAVIEGVINFNQDPIPVLATVNWFQRYFASVFSIPWIFKDTVAPPWPDDADGWENFIWLLQFVAGPLRGGIIMLSPFKDTTIAGKVADVSLTIWGALHLAGVSYLAGLQGDDSDADKEKIAENVLACLCPQMLKILRVPPIPQVTDQLSLAALSLLTVASELEIAALHASRTLRVA